METWLDDLHDDPLPWLLHGSEPTVRHLALRHLLDRPPDNPEVRRPREEAMLMTLCACSLLKTVSQARGLA